MKLPEQIMAFIPFNEQERRDKQELLSWLDSGADIYTRRCNAAHLTASAWVVSPDREKALMAYHNLYDSWAWLGGHADGGRESSPWRFSPWTATRSGEHMSPPTCT